MSHKSVSMQSFLTRATTTLQTMEAELAGLANDVLSYPQAEDGSDNGHSIPMSRMSISPQQISRYLLKLAEYSRMLQMTLQDDTTGGLVVDDYWPQIRILQSQEEERTQLARELEDSVGQLLANAIFELASCRHLLVGGQESVSDGLDALQEELEQGLTDVRHFITNLEPTTILGNFGLADGLRRYLEQYQAKTGLESQLRVQANIGRLPSIIETAIFRVVQEALSNVYRHANATRVDVIVEEREGSLQFNVIDNGDGLISEKIGATKRNLGLARMVDYAELLNGELKILSDPGHGTQVTLRVSYPSL